MSKPPLPYKNTITPYLLYEDVGAALTWLANAFGFRERLRYVEPSGVISHAEMEVGDALILLGHPGPTYRNPKHSGESSQFTCVLVPDADAHFRRAREAGATIKEEPEDKPWGHRAYDVLDPEGHRWSFAHHIRDVTPEEWGAQRAESK
jgi:uncharacterized glyoxalase superfamily protein PhnB